MTGYLISREEPETAQNLINLINEQLAWRDAVGPADAVPAERNPSRVPERILRWTFLCEARR